MSQKAGELGLILENNLGSRTEVIVETRQDQQGRLYEDGRGQQSYNGQQSSEQQHSDKKQNETETIFDAFIFAAKIVFDPLKITP